jgi:hypothetical protein
VVLREEILAIEVIVDSLVTWNIGVQVRVAGTHITAVKPKLQMLNRNMALPFVLGAQRHITTIVRK